MQQPSNNFMQASTKANLPVLPIPHAKLFKKPVNPGSATIRPGNHGLMELFAEKDRVDSESILSRAVSYSEIASLDVLEGNDLLTSDSLCTPDKSFPVSGTNSFSKTAVFKSKMANVSIGKKVKKFFKRMNPFGSAGTAKQQRVSLFKKQKVARGDTIIIVSSFKLKPFAPPPTCMENVSETTSNAPATPATPATPDNPFTLATFIAVFRARQLEFAKAYLFGNKSISTVERMLNNHKGELIKHEEKLASGKLRPLLLTDCRFAHTHGTDTTSSFVPKTPCEWACVYNQADHQLARIRCKRTMAEIERSREKAVANGAVDNAKIAEIWSQGVSRCTKEISDKADAMVKFLQPNVSERLDLDCYIRNMKNPTPSSLPDNVFADEEYRLLLTKIHFIEYVIAEKQKAMDSNPS